MLLIWLSSLTLISDLQKRKKKENISTIVPLHFYNMSFFLWTIYITE